MSNEKTINFTFNFNSPVGQNIAHVDKLEAHFDKEMTMQVVDTVALCREGVKSASKLHHEELARAVESVQSYFWAQSSWAVVYCVCRDHLGMKDNMSEFEKLVQGLTFTKNVYKCPAGTIQKAIANNDYMRYPIHRWPEGRSSRLAAELVKSLGIIP